ncbi:glycosyltransferase family 2 protein [Marinimicrobium locisalis]|uniref:glycosyltransferase family 2 protein n=1 Tax=Marinimicrobium locisalis TaxID=546022 RepID=UPI0032215793
MSLFISIISHENSAEIIHNLKPHELISAERQVVLLDNKPAQELEHYARDNGLHYLKNDKVRGFGSNHNRVFRHCRDHLGMHLENDWFIILNPDLECDPENLARFATDMETEGARIGAPNIFKDSAFQEHEESVRRFPYLWELVTSYLFRKNRTGVDRCSLTACEVDWASGACLAFRADTFEALKGFDERYFLYYEDVDICWRARHLLGLKTYYIPGAKMVHRGKRASHTLNNKHLWWHLTSAVRFAWVRTKTALLGPESLN